MNLYTEGVTRVWDENAEDQINYLKTMHEVVRNMTNIDSLIEAKAFYVPNATYLTHFFGSEISHPRHGFYNFENKCTWTHYIMFPIWNLKGEVVSLAGYDIMSKAEQLSGIEVEKDNYYRYQSSSIFHRGRYLYMIPGVYERAITDGYILLVDGFYDKHNLHNSKFNAASSFGSQVTEYILFILSFIENVFILVDNDTAGSIFFRTLSKYRKNVFEIKQGITKDADELLKLEYKEKYEATIREAIRLRAPQLMKSPTLWGTQSKSY